MNRLPNVLFIMTDQQRFDAMSCAGNPEIRTPNMDRLAADGVLFRQACTTTPVCVAARQSLITGHRLSRTHWVDNRSLPGPNPELPTIMTMLHDLGYWNHCVGKTHFFNRHYGLHRHESAEEVRHSYVEDDYLTYLRRNHVPTRQPNGFRDLLYFQPQVNTIPVEHHKTTWVTDRSIEFLRTHTKYNPNRPFFLWASYTAPHPPFAPPAPYESMYDPEFLGLPENPERALADIPSPAWGHRRRMDGAHRDPERLRRIRALYYGLTTQVDDGVGRLLDELERLGLYDDTVIVFFSDHGDMLGDHGLSQKNVPYEHSVRIPFILRWPGKTDAGRTSEEPVGLTDVLPTLIHGLGGDYPSACGPLDGISLLAPGGGLLAPRRELFIDYGVGSNRWISLRSADYKYAYWLTGGIEELYDLSTDPWETHNLAEEEPERSAELRSRVLAWELENGFRESVENGALTRLPAPKAPAADIAGVVVNDSKWPDNLPTGEREELETFSEAFTKAIAKESTLAPEKLSIADYKRKGGDLRGTPWEAAWRAADAGTDTDAFAGET